MRVRVMVMAMSGRRVVDFMPLGCGVVAGTTIPSVVQ